MEPDGPIRVSQLQQAELDAEPWGTTFPMPAEEQQGKSEMLDVATEVKMCAGPTDTECCSVGMTKEKISVGDPRKRVCGLMTEQRKE